MPRVSFPSNLQRFTNGEREISVAATRYGDLLDELQRRYPGLTESLLGKYAIAIDGVITQSPLLETFAPDSELLFVAKIAGG